MHHFMCPWRPHRAPTTLVTWPLPSLQGCCCNFHQSPSECHFNSACLGEPGDSPSSRVPRKIAESPGLAEATDVTQASSLRPSNRPFLTVIHSGCLLLSPQRPSTGRQECRDLAVCGSSPLWPPQIPHPNDCPADRLTSTPAMCSKDSPL